MIERTILASRWILIVIYFGLVVGLAIYALAFLVKLFKVVTGVFSLGENDMILAMLSLIDASLVGGLLVMVIISGYENYISRIDIVEAESRLSWLGKLDSSSLKIKLASSIVAISSIHLLQVFLNVENYADDKILWATIIHVVFIFSAILMGWLDRIMADTTDRKKAKAAPDLPAA
jgi:uncharacterized protein (TIGR00645 family)